MSELERLTENAAFHREELRLTALRKSRLRGALNISAGVLALLSAGAITTVLTDLFGHKGIQVLAAFIAAASGTISLLVSTHFEDGEIFAMLSGATKYLELREATWRLAINPRLSDEQRFDMLADLQVEYVRLDEAYARYLSFHPGYNEENPGARKHAASMSPRIRGEAIRAQSLSAARNDVAEFHKRLNDQR
jgi:hypothetical protein